MKMPIFDGERLTDYWKLTNSSVLRRVILLTGYSRLSPDRDFGTFAVIQKPFDYRQLLTSTCPDSGHFSDSAMCPECTV